MAKPRDSSLKPAPMKRHARIKKRRLQFDSLEARRLMAVGNDFYELRSNSDLYSDDFFLSTADPVIPTIDATGRYVFDFSADRPGDQTTDLIFADDLQIATRIKINSKETYQFAFLGQEGEGDLVIEAYASGGVSLGQVAVPYRMQTLDGLNFFNWANFHAMIGPGGTRLPDETVWIDIVTPNQLAYPRFGFATDYAFTFQSDRSVDEHKSPVTLGIDTTQSYVLTAQVINPANSSSAQLHSLGYISLDADRMVIEPIHTQKYGSSLDARLTSPLNPGDTQIALTTTEGWSNTSSDPGTRALAWYGYRDSSGTLYPDFSYTRNVARDASDGLWSRSGIVGNTIKLIKPWSGPALPAGTAMRNAINGDPLVPALLDYAPTVSSLSTTLHGQWTDGIAVAGQFAPGTQSIRLAATLNQSSVLLDDRLTVRMQFGQNDSVKILAPNNQSRTVTLDVLANDSSSEIEIVGVTQGKRGSVEIAAGGRQVVYRSQDFFIGTDAFEYMTADSAGNRSTHQVQLKSLGGNLDSDTTLRNIIETAAQTPAQYYPNVQQASNFSGVKNQTLSSSLYGNYIIQRHSHRLDEIGFQSGSLSVMAGGKFDYQPEQDATGRFSFLYTISNGSDTQPFFNTITVAESEFRRDQVRMSEIGVSVANLESAHKKLFYPGALPVDSNGRSFLSWRVHILPFLGYYELHGKFKLDEPWNSANNLPLLAEMPDVFRSAGESLGTTTTRYQAIANSAYPGTLKLLLNNADGRGDLPRLSNMTDGVQNTILLVQAGADKAVPWTQNVDLAYDAANPLATLGNVGPYFNAYFWDNKVRALPTDMDNAVFQALATPSQSDIADSATLTRQARSRSDFPGDNHVQNNRFQEQQMKVLLLAMHNFESAFKRLAPSTIGTMSTFSWRVWLLPYLGQQALFDQFHINEAWDSPHNLSVAANMPDVFRSLGDNATSTTTRMRVLGGANMAYGGANSLRLGPRLVEFTDGPFNTILMVEAGTDRAVPWTMPETLAVDPANFWGSMGNLTGDRMLMGMGDSSLAWADRTTPNELMIGLATMNQGDSGRAAFQATQRVLDPTIPMEIVNKLKQIGLAAHNFESTYRFWPNNFVGGFSTLPTSTNVGLSWRVAILPFLEETALYNRFHLDEPWDSPHNLSLLPLMPDVFRSAGSSLSDFTTRIQRFSGLNTIDPKQKLRFAHVTDGLSNTIFAGVVGEEKAVPWTKPDDIEYGSRADWSVIGNTEFMPALLGDGSVISLHYVPDLGVSSYYGPYSGDPKLTFAAMVERNDGIVSPGWARTVVIGENGAVAFNVQSIKPLILELEDPSLAEVSSRADGYVTDFGAQQRITIEANSSRNGKRQTKLYVKTLSDNPDSPPRLLQTIDLIFVDSDQAPRLESIADLSIAEDAIGTKINLTGISAGPRERQSLTLSARSLSPGLLEAATINYQPGATTATLSLTPIANQSGTAVIEVTAMDAGADGDISTTFDNGVARRTFTVTVEDVNDAPTINSIAEVSASEDSGAKLTTITGIGPGLGENQPLRITATTDSLLVALSSTNLVLSGTTTTVRWTPVADRFGQAVVLIQVEDGGLDNNLATRADNGVTVSPLTITLTPTNDAPTITRPANQFILEDEPELVVPLEYFSSGPYELDDVLLTASAVNAQLVQELLVERTPGSTQGQLRIKPQPNQFGSSMITLRAEDGGADDDLSTTADNLVTLTTFELVVQAVNDAPELDNLENLVVDVGASNIEVRLSGISAGGNEAQPLRITAAVDRLDLMTKPEVETISGTSGKLKFSTVGNAPGQAIVRVVLEDGGLDGNLATRADNLTTTRQFAVTTNVVPAVGDDRFRIQKNTASTLNVLANDVDVSDSLTVTIIQAPPVSQGTAQVNIDGTLTFAPVAGFVGVANLSYRVTDSHGRSSSMAEVMIGVASVSYQNPFNTLDVNSDGFVTALDALLIINTLNDPNHPKHQDEYTGSDDLDTSGDGAFTAIDALLVINDLNN